MGAGQITENANYGFGISGKFTVEKNAGFYVVQTVGAIFNLGIDNYNKVTSDTNPSVSNNDYVLRLEGYNQGPIINISAQSYEGTLVYSKGKSSTAENTAIWADLTDDYQGLNNVSGGMVNARNCGRAFYLENNISGVGKFDSVWEQWSLGDSTFKSIADLTFDHYETTVAYNSSAGSLIFNQCGLLHFGTLALGSGGKPLCAFNYCQRVNIANAYLVLGESYALTEANYATGIEVSGSCFVSIGNCALSGPNGRGFSVGRGGHLAISKLHCNGISQIGVITNLSTYLTTSDDSGSSTWKTYGRIVIDSSSGLYVNRSGQVVGSKPCFLIQSDAGNLSELTVNKMDFEFTHNGFTEEADRYYVYCNSNNAIVNINGAILTDSSAPIYCKDHYNIGSFKHNQMPSGVIVFSTGTRTITGGKSIAMTAPTFNTTTPITNTTNHQIEYYYRFSVASGGNLQILKNNVEIGYVPTASATTIYPIHFTLYPGETAKMNANDNTLITTPVSNANIKFS